jgi:hypothetical protein
VADSQGVESNWIKVFYGLLGSLYAQLNILNIPKHGKEGNIFLNTPKGFEIPMGRGNRSLAFLELFFLFIGRPALSYVIVQTLLRK